eukprot:12159587-Ditylum_brightwellii.AAC.1
MALIKGDEMFSVVESTVVGKKRQHMLEKKVERPRDPPIIYAEAIFQQQPKVEKKLKELCAMLAKCQIGFDNRTDGLMPIIERELQKAANEQLELGNDAEYRFILFPDKDENDPV